MAAPREVIDLIERFERNSDSYRNSAYNETETRREFIDPFFKALGWDIDNEQGYAEAYKDVVHEDAIKIGGLTKAPDYAFRIGGARKFFVEAKRPGVDIKNDPDPAYQLRRYAWSAKLPLSILTDFEEFAVYDCRIRPNRADKASMARTKYFTYKEYEARWDEIAAIFSREAILKGSFDKYVESSKKKRGTAEVDDAFLKEIETWRDLLARNIALRNPDLSTRELNYAVQRTVDRIIFLRICEDRGVESYGQLRALQNGVHIYPRLCQIFRHADERYNSGLFHFSREKDRNDLPDDLTLGLSIDDKVLKEIFKGLYYPESPFEFSVLPADILGHIYEQFLGKVIRLTPGHHAKVEDKPEVKKAGGVYYTPTYIVDYIVKNTVGKLLKRKTPNLVAKLRVLDPACGSGSFLLGAYQYLLDWHQEWYAKHDPQRHAKGRSPKVYQGPGGEWRLTTAEKKRILLNNIYGVDIDTQAVEVTKLSLLLKVLEGENAETLGKSLRLFHERALPDLGDNIKCGNSLIGPDFYEGQQLSLLDDEERYRINAFDWNAEFSEIMKAGGFDAVIGNPPYVRPHKLATQIKEYFWHHYSTFVKKSDLYCCFVERSVFLLKRRGTFGFIISNGWLRLDSFENLRRFLLDNTSIDRIIDFTSDVFENASVKTAVLLFTKGSTPGYSVQIATTEPTPNLAQLTFKELRQDLFRETYKSIFDLSIEEYQEQVKRKICRFSAPLSELFALSFGLKTGDDSKFLTFNPETSDHKRLLRGKDVHRYSYTFKGEYVWYAPKKMTQHRRTARPGMPERFEQPKLLVRDTGGALEGTFDGSNYYVKDVLIISEANKDAARLKFLLGILNSGLMKFYYETSFPTLHVQRDELASLPIRRIDLANPADKAHHDRMVELVEALLKLHKQLTAAKTSHEKTAIQRQIDITDKLIDQLVYELYGLTKEEVGIVEEASE